LNLITKTKAKEIMKNAKNEITLIYNSSNIQDRQAFAYAKSLKDRKLKAIDIQENKLTETQLKSIANALNKNPGDLIDKHSTKYLRYFVDSDLSQKEVLKTLKANPSMLNTPILMHKDGATFVKNHHQLVSKGLDF